MKIEKTSLDGVLILEPEFRFKDDRGELVCAFEETLLAEILNSLPFCSHKFPKHNFSVSRQNVLRGIHVSNCYKLAYCPFGNIYLVAVDCREHIQENKGAWTIMKRNDNFGNMKRNDNFGKWTAAEINDDNRKMILVPPMFGLAHLVLSRVAVFYYHWSDAFDGDRQKSYHYKSFGISWPVENPILSERDKNATLICYDGTAVM